jgi:hypothetical protein
LLTEARRLDFDISACLSGRFLSRHRQLTNRLLFGGRAPRIIDGHISVLGFLIAILHCIVVAFVKASF